MRFLKVRGRNLKVSYLVHLDHAQDFDHGQRPNISSPTQSPPPPIHHAYHETHTAFEGFRRAARQKLAMGLLEEDQDPLYLVLNDGPSG